MGFLGPILNRYLGMAGGAEVVSSAFAMTALVFGGLSAYVLITRKDMSFLSGFITAGFFVLLVRSWPASSSRSAACNWRSALASCCSRRVHPVPDQRDHSR